MNGGEPALRESRIPHHPPLMRSALDHGEFGAWLDDEMRARHRPSSRDIFLRPGFPKLKPHHLDATPTSR